MASKPTPMTSEAIALTEKKMDMALDDIIKMSKKPSSKTRNMRIPNKNRGFLNGGSFQGTPFQGTPFKGNSFQGTPFQGNSFQGTPFQGNSFQGTPFQGNSFQGSTARMQRFMGSRSSVRQGVLAQRRANFRGNQFPLTTEIAKKAAVTPIRNRAFTRPGVGTWSKPRVPSVSVVTKAAPANALTGGRANVVSKQRPQTLDSLFADMKEERMKALSRQQQGNNQRNARPPFRRGYQGRGAGGGPANVAFRNKFSM